MKLKEEDFKELQVIKDFLLSKAEEDQAFKAKLNECELSFHDFRKYIVDQAKKLSTSNDCGCFEDKVVYGWAIHAVDEWKHLKVDEIPQCEIKTTPKVETKVEPEKEVKKPAKKETKKKEFEQLSIFDLLGGNND